MTRPIIILGAGGHAKVLAEALSRSGTPIIGCVAPEAPAESAPAVPYLGGDAVLERYQKDEVALANGIGSTARPTLRCDVFRRFTALGYRFATIIHPSVVMARDVRLGDGAQLMAGVVIQPGCGIGENTIINTGASIDHDCQIGTDAHLAPGVVLSGGVTVGARAHIGTRAAVIQGISIGADAVIGAGAVVVSDIPEGTVAVGVPAKCIRKQPA